MPRLLSSQALRATISIAAGSSGITFVPARTWSGDPVSRVVTYPERALRVWLRDENPLVDLGPQPKGVLIHRRLASLFTRLGALLVESAPKTLQRDAVRASGAMSPEEIVSTFWHAEHGLIEAALRAQSPHAVSLGYYPAYGVDWRAYENPTFPVEVYGTLANPDAPNTDPGLRAVLAPLTRAATRAERWALLLTLLPQLEEWRLYGSEAVFAHGIDQTGTTLLDETPEGALSVDDIDDEDGDVEYPGVKSAAEALKESMDREPTYEVDPEAFTEMEPSEVTPPSSTEPDEDDGFEYSKESWARIDPIAGAMVPSEDLRYDDDITANVELEQQMLQPTIAALMQATEKIMGVSRSIRVRKRHQRHGRFESSRMMHAVAQNSKNIFARSRHIPKGTRISFEFMVDDSGSMNSPTEATFGPAIDMAHPDMREIDAIRLLGLALANVAFASDGLCAITTINHPTVTAWTPKTTGKALARFIADGGSEPDASLQAALNNLHRLPGPRIIVFLTDGAVCATDALAVGVPLIPIVPKSYHTDTLYGHPVVRLDRDVVKNFAARLEVLVSEACSSGEVRSVA